MYCTLDIYSCDLTWVCIVLFHVGKDCIWLVIDYVWLLNHYMCFRSFLSFSTWWYVVVYQFEWFSWIVNIMLIDFIWCSTDACDWLIGVLESHMIWKDLIIFPWTKPLEQFVERNLQPCQSSYCAGWPHLCGPWHQE